MSRQAREAGVNLLSGAAGGVAATKINSGVSTAELMFTAFGLFAMTLTAMKVYEYIYGPPLTVDILEKLEEDDEEENRQSSDRHGPAS